MPYPHWKIRKKEHSYRLAIPMQSGPHVGPGCMMPFPAIGLWNMAKTTDLDCLYCGALWEEGLRKRIDTFPDFASLALHVQGEHNPQNLTDKEREALVKLNEGMLNQNTQLLPGMLANLGNSAKISGVREAGKEFQYSDYVLEVQIEKSKYDIPCKVINEDFRALAKALGLDTDKWAGRNLKLSTDEYTSNRTGKTSDIIRFELSK